MEQNNNQNAILQMLLKEKWMNNFYPLKNLPASDAWAYQDNEGNLCVCDNQLKPIHRKKVESMTLTDGIF